MENTIIDNREKISIGKVEEVRQPVRFIVGGEIPFKNTQQPTEGVGHQLEDDQEKANVPAANSEGIIPEQSINFATAGSRLSSPNVNFRIEREIMKHWKNAERRRRKYITTVLKLLFLISAIAFIWEVFKTRKEYLISPVTEIDLNFNTTICNDTDLSLNAMTDMNI